MSNQRKEVPLEQPESHAYKSKTDPPQYIVIASLTDTWNGPGEVFEEDGIVYERTDHVEIDLDQIPDHVRDDLARTVIEMAREYFRQPGIEEKYQAWLKEKKHTRQDTKGKWKAEKTGA